VAAFKEDMDVELRYYKESAVTRGAQRIMTAGEPEILKAAYNRQYGVPVHEKVWEGLNILADQLNIPFDLAK
jgi:LDH2 family malate/lactate/ureidoglycolate dehydrogenase